jgi:hypothetical protein
MYYHDACKLMLNVYENILRLSIRKWNNRSLEKCQCQNNRSNKIYIFYSSCNSINLPNEK